MHHRPTIAARWWSRCAWLCVLALYLAAAPVAADGFSLRFFGNGVDAPGLDRVEIPLDDPHRPVDVGLGDFTVEWWMKAALADNDAPACEAGADNWIYGNILLDRDVFGPGDWGDWGVSLRGGEIAFGVAVGSWGEGICGSTVVADGLWHHLAVTRRGSDGRLQVYVDGQLDGAVPTGPVADMTYRDGRSTPFEKDPFLVLGAEKHDAGPQFPSYSGWLDELRLSTVLRYDGDFTPPAAPFVPDGATAALYHLDEGGGDLVADVSGAAGGPSHGQRRFGGDPAGPLWSADTPFGADPGLIFADGFESGDTTAWSGTGG